MPGQAEQAARGARPVRRRLTGELPCDATPPLQGAMMMRHFAADGRLSLISAGQAPVASFAMPFDEHGRYAADYKADGVDDFDDAHFSAVDALRFILARGALAAEPLSASSAAIPRLISHESAQRRQYHGAPRHDNGRCRPPRAPGARHSPRRTLMMSAETPAAGRPRWSLPLSRHSPIHARGRC